MLFSGIPRVALLHQPTPLELVPGYGRAIGHPNLWLKRDDVMPLGLGGNKVRSLEFWLGQALEQECDVVLTAGLPVSNLCRLTAAACCKLGLRCILVHNAPEGAQGGGNGLLNALMGVERHYCGPVDEAARTAATEQLAAQLAQQGHKPYIVADQVIGALGYVAAAAELMAQAEQQRLDLRHVFISASAGPTEAGLLFGLHLLCPKVQTHLVSVEYTQEVFWPICQDIYQKLACLLGQTPALGPRENTHFYGQYLGEGYGKITPQATAAMEQLARTEGIFIDATYNAKVFAGLADLCAQGQFPQEEGIALVHTGGLPSLFGSDPTW